MSGLQSSGNRTGTKSAHGLSLWVFYLKSTPALLIFYLLLVASVLLTSAALVANSRQVMQEQAVSEQAQRETARRQIEIVALVGAAVMAVGLFATSLVARQITEPVIQIAKAAAALQAGEFHPGMLSGIAKHSGELGQAARIFEDMAREVSARDRRLSLMRYVIPVGVSLSAERDFNRLLETIVFEAQKLCNADAGTLYLLAEDQTLQFVIVRNTSLGITMGGTSGNVISFPSLRLYDPATGMPNHNNVATHSALTGVRTNIPDAYHAEGFDFSGTKAFDARTGYRSTSFLTIPLKGDDQKVIGVLQLINAIEAGSGEIVAFAPDDVIESLVLLAYGALSAYIREQSLRNEIEKLRIEIDAASQAREVAEITESDYFQQLQQKVRLLRGRESAR